MVSWSEGNRKPKTRQLHSTAGMGTISGAFWGFLFALTIDATAPDKVIDELKPFDFQLISTNLPEEQERQLHEAFAEE